MSEMSESEINELVEASSLGTPAAKAFRESVSDEDVDRIIERLNEHSQSTMRHVPQPEVMNTTRPPSTRPESDTLPGG